MTFVTRIISGAILAACTTIAVANTDITLPSGVQVSTLIEGAGATPSATDTVLVHYRGTLLDGTEFDSSFKRNEPISFPLNRVIPCWTEGLQQMKEGGKAQLQCPSKTAYGSRAMGSAIPANSDLIFEVELIKVN